MKIERVDEKTVKCFISNEELEAYEITYKDFVLRSTKAKEIVEVIIEQAEEEVGYQPPKFAFDLQIMMLPDKGMVLTFSEKSPEEEIDGNLLEYLKEMKDLLDKRKAKMYQPESEALSQPEPGARNQSAKEQKPRTATWNFCIFAFENLRDVRQYALVLPQGLRIKSSLYNMGDAYFMVLEKGTAAQKKYGAACVLALEFGSLYGAEEQKLLYLKEHGQCLIAEQAVKKLRF